MKPLVIIFILSQIADYLTTMLGLKLGLVELNPLFNPENALLVKTLVTLAVALALQTFKNKLITLVVPLMLLIVVWNITNLILYCKLPFYSIISGSLFI